MYRRDRYCAPGIAGFLDGAPTQTRRARARTRRSNLEARRLARGYHSTKMLVCLSCGAQTPYVGIPPREVFCPRCRSAMSLLRH